MKSDDTRPRAIIHLDLDAFFAAVEALENFGLDGKPIIVGGRPDQRGVVSTASYEARALGVHSAMPTARALQLCPQAILLKPRYGIYKRYSQQVMAILHKVTPLVEQISIDEAFMDVTDIISEWTQAIDLARQLQSTVRSEVKLSASVGVATNKLVAKIASDQDKPNGLTVVHSGQEAAFLEPLPVRVLWGVGPKTAQKLAQHRLVTVGDLVREPQKVLSGGFGKQGKLMLQQAQGIDSRPVITEHERKSLSQERTFAQDVLKMEVLEKALAQMCMHVAQSLQLAELAAGTITLKLRYADFTTLTRQISLSVPTNNETEISDLALRLLERTWERRRPVRLVGVAAHRLDMPSAQLRLL